MKELNSGSIAVLDYPSNDFSSESSAEKKEETENRRIIANIPSTLSRVLTLTKQISFPLDIMQFFLIDSSSVYPCFRPLPISSSFVDTSLKLFSHEQTEIDLEQDIVFHIPHANKYVVKLKIRKIEKAIPRFIRPD